MPGGSRLPEAAAKGGEGRERGERREGGERWEGGQAAGEEAPAVRAESIRRRRRHCVEVLFAGVLPVRVCPPASARPAPAAVVVGGGVGYGAGDRGEAAESRPRIEATVVVEGGVEG